MTRSVLAQASVMTASGLFAGIVGALAVTRFIGGQQYGVRATDPLSFLAAAAALILVALAAGFVPTRRALGEDPVSAIRSE